MEEYETIEKGNKILKIFYMEDAENPREWDNLSKVVLNHKRYTFPNELNINFDSFASWEEIAEHIKKELKAVLVFAVRGYEHSGLSISLSSEYPFNDSWDSGQLGFICILEEDLIKEFGKNTKETRKKAEAILKGEFKTFKNYLEGEVFGFELYKKVRVKITKEYSKTKKETTTETENKLLDSCWGFYGEEGINQIKEENGF